MRYELSQVDTSVCVCVCVCVWGGGVMGVGGGGVGWSVCVGCGGVGVMLTDTKSSIIGDKFEHNEVYVHQHNNMWCIDMDRMLTTSSLLLGIIVTK